MPHGGGGGGGGDEFSKRSRDLLARVPAAYRQPAMPPGAAGTSSWRGGGGGGSVSFNGSAGGAGAGAGVADLVREVVEGAGGREAAEERVRALRVLEGELSELQRGFVASHSDACGRSMQQYTRLVGDLALTTGTVGDLKAKVMRLRRATGSHAPDLVALHKRRRRDGHLLRVLCAIQDVQDMRGGAAAALASGDLAGLARRMRRHQTLYDRWPLVRGGGLLLGDAGGGGGGSGPPRPALPAVCGSLQRQLQAQVVDECAGSVEAALLASVHGDSGGGRAAAAAAAAPQRPGVSSAAAAAAAEGATASLVAAAGGGGGGAEATPLHEMTPLWCDDGAAALATCPSQELVRGVLLRGPVRRSADAPPLTIRVAAVSAAVYLGMPRGGEVAAAAAATSNVAGGSCDGAGEPVVPGAEWEVSAAALGVLGGGGAQEGSVGGGGGGGAGGVTASADEEEDGWVFYRRHLEAGETCEVAVGGLWRAVVVVVPAAAAAARRRAECLTALHVLGGVGASAVSGGGGGGGAGGGGGGLPPHHRVLDAVRRLLRDDAQLRKRFREEAETVLHEASDPARTAAEAAAATTTTTTTSSSAAFSFTPVVAAASSAAATGFAEERRAAAQQRQRLARTARVLFGGLLRALRGYADLARQARERCCPAVVPPSPSPSPSPSGGGGGGTPAAAAAGYLPASALLTADGLSAVARALRAATEATPAAAAAAASSSGVQRRALAVAKRAAELLADGSGSPWELRNLAGPRRAKGWLGAPPRRQKTLRCGGGGGEAAAASLLVDETMVVCAGPAAAVGCTLLAVDGVSVATPADFRAAAGGGGGGGFLATLQKPAAPPLAAARAVAARVRRVCAAAAAETRAGPEAEAAAAESLAERVLVEAERVVREVAAEEGALLELDRCWAALQAEVSAVLELWCGGGTGGVVASAPLTTAVVGGGAASHSALGVGGGRGGGGSDGLEKLLQGASRGSSAPRLLEAAPVVTFSLGAAAAPLAAVSAGPAAAATGSEAEAPVPAAAAAAAASPFNALAVYRATLQFETDARKVVGGGEHAGTGALSGFLEKQARAALLPRMRRHYTSLATESTGRIAPVVPAAAAARFGARPVQEAMVLAAQGVGALLDVGAELPYARSDAQAHAAALIDHLLDLSLAQLKVRLGGTFAGEIVLPLAKQLLGGSGGGGVDPSAAALWAASRAPDAAAPSAVVDAVAARHAARRGGYQGVEAAQDVSFLALAAHSLEWLADRVRMRCAGTPLERRRRKQKEGGMAAAAAAAAEDAEEDSAAVLVESPLPCWTSPYPSSDEGGGGGGGAAGGGVAAASSSASVVPPPTPPALPAALAEACRRLDVLAGCACAALQADLVARCATLLGDQQLAADAAAAAERDRRAEEEEGVGAAEEGGWPSSVEPDEFVGVFNRDARRLHALYAGYLPERKLARLVQSLPALASFYLVRALRTGLRAHADTARGVVRLQRNVCSLQQNLALLVGDVARSDEHFFRVRGYYQLLHCAPHELEARRAELEAVAVVSYSDDEFQAVETIVIEAHKKACERQAVAARS